MPVHVAGVEGSLRFVGLWQEAQTAMEEVDDNTTLQDLIDDERTAAEQSDLPVYAV